MTTNPMNTNGSATYPYLAAYHFDGEPGPLMAAYQRLLEQFPLDSLLLHLCIVRDGGLTVFDACPSRAAHDEFVRNPMFVESVAAAGLPAPRIEALGDVRVAHVAVGVRA